MRISAVSGRMMRGSGVSPARNCSRTLVPLTETGFSSGCFSVSGTKVREQLRAGDHPDPRIMRPETADILIEAYRS